MLQNPEVIQGIIGKIRDTISTFIEIAGELLADIVEVGGDIADTLTPFSSTDYSDRADIFAAKVRANSLEMAKNVKSLGGNLQPVTVGDKQAVKEAKSNQQAPSQQPDNRMKPNPENNKDMVINLHYHNADEINTFSTKLGKGISIDTQFGHSGYTVANNNAI